MTEDNNDVPQTVGQYLIIKILGSGAFATVYLAQHTITLAMVALKCIQKRKLKNQAEFELLQREINLFRAMDHPFISSFFEVLEDEKNFYIAMEMVENGSLLDLINNNKGLSESQARRVFIQLLTVMQYLHYEKHVVHRDLKAENVLLDRFYNVRLVDFGLSKAFSKNDPFLQTTCGSPAYVAPEIIKELPYTSDADIWSLGILLYAMVCGTLPFNGDNISLMLQQIISINPPVPNHLSPELKNLISKLLIKDPNARIKLPDILKHSWIVDYEDPKGLLDDLESIKNLSLVHSNEVDAGVMSEMRILGYDTAGIAQDLSQNTINQRTAAYKMLKRQKTIDEIKVWQEKRDQRVQTKPKAAHAISVLNGNGKFRPTVIQPRRWKRGHHAKS
ncbi:CAMK family protein kinase [Tritrichomonas foetus]|uniref:non-specific serine/threonine protein kinase n=1 Tax=Tritrichomonas foetus TaxID=1144522 RepID=A0A1J4JG76_9EUKA|nr:CAMK family protein kinase [Tritrichomonas foetus]|eukprot:OHS97673.1 CAMK family protein kinase [Tritrichomonas foetus]